ncbi:MULTISPECIES: MFS transporter [unclassified Pseudomonas]|uniref:MFS transporter n=1 Tax=unclassified Pseudomonas TaxID=196821 RepID=UPI000CD2E36A|nr:MULTISPECIES: MFS transporter [unclassified Pseudomonas]POA51763.1 MFS transporter [Pseudomonas sp. FW507-12TSA]
MTTQPDSLKWRVLIGSFLSYTFDALDILVLIIALPTIQESLHISASQAGLMVTATLLGVGVSSLVMGTLADTLGRKKALLASLVAFGGLTMAIAAASDWKQILVLRFFAGLGLGGVWGVVAAHVHETWPARQRGRATAFVLSAFSAGSGLAALLAAGLLQAYGWRTLFFLSGALVLVPVLYVALRVPESAAWLARRHRQPERADARPTLAIAQLFGPGLARRTLLGSAASALALTAYWGTMTWIPTFLVKHHGLSSTTMANLIAVMNVGAFIGYNLFGWLADRLGKRRMVIVSLVGSGLMLPVYIWVADSTLLLVLGPVYAFFLSFVGLFGSYFAQLYPTHLRASGAGFCFNTGRGLSAFSPILLGSLASSMGLSLSLGFCGVLFLLAAVAVCWLPAQVQGVGDPEPLPVADRV